MCRMPDEVYARVRLCASAAPVALVAIGVVGARAGFEQ